MHGLPLSYTRPDVKRYEGAQVSTSLSPATAKLLQRVSKQFQITPFMLLHGALSLVLSRHSNSTDIVIGTPVANRLQPELAPLIGFFVNTLVLRVDTSHETLGEYFKHISQVHLNAQSNQGVPFEQLVDRLKVPRSTAHSPVFQIMMTTNTDYGLDNDINKDAIALSGVDIQPYQTAVVYSQFDLSVDISLGEAGGAVSWTYDVSLFSESYINQLNQHLCRLLAALSDVDAAKPFAVRDLSMLSADEINHLVHELNDTALDYPNDICIHELFEQQAAERPDAVAVVYEGEQLTYRELNQQANRLAHYLVAQHDIGPDTLVGICVGRSLAMVIGVLAILKSGGAYVPLDPSYPVERIQYMLDDAALGLVLSDSVAQQSLTGFDGQVLLLDGLADLAGHLCDDCPSTNLPVSDCGLSVENLAYIIYTSGSTGRPKGVAIEHRNTCAMLHWARSEFDDAMISRVLASTSLNFDLSIFELFVPLSFGGCCVVVPDALALLDKHYDVTLINTVPSAIKALLEQRAIPASVQCINLAGEPLAVPVVNRILADTACRQVYNLYGPSEDTTYSTYVGFSSEVTTPMTIGRVVANSQAYILGDSAELLPKGCIGELYLGGLGVARGYYNKPELTAERFIANPYYDPENATSSARLYKTGDLVRYLPDGNIAFLGRIDDQVKIRGFRIELGEVEEQLTQHATVDSAVVITKEVAGSEQLVGYIKPQTKLDEAERQVFVRDVKTAISAQLPDYMVPAILMAIEQWPLIANGKLNKKALPDPDGSALQGEYVAPKNSIEEALVSLWQDVLGIAPIGITANFFDVGGNSLLLTRLKNKFKDDFSIEVPIKFLFEYQTIAVQASVLEIYLENNEPNELHSDDLIEEEL
ncbi:MAG TPA: amino acid adenylation domain-containing protein [Methylophaga sp.]|nr:amino acid adenylation domain-containing protein [Methylophaga sp.]